MYLQFSLFLLTAVLVLAGQPHERRGVQSHAPPKAVNKSDIPYFSQAAGLCQADYCWSPEGQQVGDAKLLWEYGTGVGVQRALLFHSKSMGLTVAFEGTNSTTLWSIIHDVGFWMDEPNAQFRDALPKGAKVMYSFQDAYLKVARHVVMAIKQHQNRFNDSRISITGHSLGAAMGLLASVHLAKEFPNRVDKVVLFGLPRLGNAEFTNHVDRMYGSNLHWIVNGRDWVPHLPWAEIGYQQPRNEIWINPANSTNWKLYPGPENVHGMNSVKNPIWTFDDHQGTYFHTQIGVFLGHCPATVGQD